MMKTIVKIFGLCAAFLIPAKSLGQDSVDVTFRYNISPFPSLLEVRGEADNWQNPPTWYMSYQGGNLWIYNARLRVGGHIGGGVPGAYQYKFYHAGIGGGPWPNDPLNHHVNTADNDNTFLYLRDPTIYHLLPNQRTGTVTTDFPTISGYIFPKVGTVVDTASLQLVIDGVTHSGLGSSYNFSTKQLTFTVPESLSNGNHTVILRAGTNADTVSFIVQVGGPPIMPLPTYAKHGVTLPGPASNDSTTFRLRVGGTGYVVVRIAPAGQPVASAEPVFMRKDPTTNDWWVNVFLPVGTYEYLYQTDNGTLLYDPWGKYNGTFGTRFSTGPEGLTADDYVWQSTNYQRPPLNKLVVYEMNLAEFAGGYYGLPAGQPRFSHLTTLLPYLDSLGINAIELMPINDYGLIGQSGFSWGYDITHHFALEPGYGTPRDFKVLVDSAHARGIAIIIDAVFNHLNDPGPLWQMQPDTSSPYFKLCSDLRFNEDQLCFFRDMDHWTPETQEYTYEVLKMWIDEYKVDGFRYDYTQGIGWQTSSPTVGILGWANRIAQEYGNTIYQIAEHLPESPALVFYSGLTGGWHDSFRDEVFDEARFRNTSLVDFENLVLDLGAYPSNDIPSSPTVYANRTEPVNGNVNHDEQSLIYEMTTFQGVPLVEAIQRDKLYAPFMFASLGIPMLWQGMEFSAPRGWMNDQQKLSYRPVEWYLLDSARGQSHYQYYKDLIRQRTRNPALFNGVLRKLFRYNTEKTLVWGFEDSTSGAKFMAVSNLTNSQQTVNSVPWLAPGDWYDVFTQSVLTVTGTTVPSMTIPANTARLYSNLSDSVLLAVGDRSAEVPTEFALEQNYPNPFNPTTRIRFSIPSSVPAGGGGTVSLRVFDLLGREVATLINQPLAPGSYTVSWDGRSANGIPVGSGVYLYRLVVNGNHVVASRKMVLLK